MLLGGEAPWRVGEALIKLDSPPKCLVGSEVEVFSVLEDATQVAMLEYVS